MFLPAWQGVLSFIHWMRSRVRLLPFGVVKRHASSHIHCRLIWCSRYHILLCDTLPSVKPVEGTFLCPLAWLTILHWKPSEIRFRIGGVVKGLSPLSIPCRQGSCSRYDRWHCAYVSCDVPKEMYLFMTQAAPLRPEDSIWGTAPFLKCCNITHCCVGTKPSFIFMSCIEHHAFFMRGMRTKYSARCRWLVMGHYATSKVCVLRAGFAKPYIPLLCSTHEVHVLDAISITQQLWIGTGRNK